MEELFYEKLKVLVSITKQIYALERIKQFLLFYEYVQAEKRILLKIDASPSAST